MGTKIRTTGGHVSSSLSGYTTTIRINTLGLEYGDDYINILTLNESIQGEFASEIGRMETLINQEATSRVTADEATAQLITTVEADYKAADDVVSAKVSQEAAARVTADTAIASDVTTLTAEVGDNYVELTDTRTVVAGQFAVWDGISIPAVGNVKLLGDVQYQYLGGILGEAGDGWVRTDKAAQDTADGKRTVYYLENPPVVGVDVGDMNIHPISKVTTVWNGSGAWVDTTNATADEAHGWVATASSLVVNPDNGAVTGWQYGDGSGFDSNFVISADKINLNGAVTVIANADMSNVTTIDGGKITAGSSINAPVINTGVINSGIVTGGTIEGTHITGAVIKASWIDLTNTGTLTDWAFYLLEDIPTAYQDNFAHNNDGTLVVDVNGYVRLAGSTKVYANVGSSSDGIYSYDYYTVDTLNRAISNTPTIHTTELLLYSTEDTDGDDFTSATPAGNLNVLGTDCSYNIVNEAVSVVSSVDSLSVYVGGSLVQTISATASLNFSVNGIPFVASVQHAATEEEYTGDSSEHDPYVYTYHCYKKLYVSTGVNSMTDFSNSTNIFSGATNMNIPSFWVE